MLISELMTDHHERCDAAFVAAEDAIRQGRWAEGSSALEAFGQALESHLTAEEELLFPAFEAATGMRQGPTQMMRYEHVQMRSLLSQMAAAAAARSGDEFAGAAETLLVLMQQHNAKEENILYPMCDQALDADADTLTQDLRERLIGCDASP